MNSMWFKISLLLFLPAVLLRGVVYIEIIVKKMIYHKSDNFCRNGSFLRTDTSISVPFSSLI